MKKQLIDFYIEFWNDFLTVEKFAEYHGITKAECTDLLNMGRKYHMQKTDSKQYFNVYES